MHDLMRSRWAAVGAAVAVTLGAGGVSLTQAALTTGEKPVYVALDSPCRLVDTRPGANNIGLKNTPIGAGETNAYEIQVTGANGDCTGSLAVPAAAVAVAANVTAIAPAAPSGRSFFTVYPANAALPTTSNLNFLNGQAPVPNKVDVGLSDTGKIKIYNHQGTAHAAVDIFGYYIDHTHDDRYYTEPEVDAALASKANTTDVTAALNTKANTTDVTAALNTKVARSQTIIIPASAFRALLPTINMVAGNSYGAYVTGGTGSPILRAPLILPVGSTISAVTYYYRDESSQNLSFNLISGSLGTVSQDFVPSFAFVTSSSSAGVRSTTISGLSYPVAANTELVFSAFNSSWTSVTPTFLTVKGIVVEYTAP